MFATIDIGTNSCLLLIGEMLPDGRVRIIADEARIPRLGEGISESENLSNAALDRTMAVLEEYQKLCDKHHVTATAAIATEALRRVSNANAFLANVKEKWGIEIEIATAEREAWLTYLACARDFGPDILVCDIGGGSTELIWGKPQPADIKSQRGLVPLYQFISIPLGSVVLTEQFIKSDPITPEEFHEVTTITDQHLIQALHSMSHRHPERMIATAGTATTIAAIEKRMTSYQHEKIHGTVLEMLDIQVIIDELRAKSISERRKISGLQKGREDVILAGAIILDRVMRRLGYDVVTVSDRGLKWGLFYEKFTPRPTR
jgi:exopolyphosphatase/guanosine-5'-triphosphate,3'-diphosphate pyrophosphatase